MAGDRWRTWPSVRAQGGNGPWNLWRGERWEHVTKPEPMTQQPSCLGLCGGSHLESGYVASPAAGSMLALGCSHLANGQVLSPLPLLLRA